MPVSLKICHLTRGAFLSYWVLTHKDQNVVNFFCVNWTRESSNTNQVWSLLPWTLQICEVHLPNFLWLRQIEMKTCQVLRGSVKRTWGLNGTGVIWGNGFTIIYTGASGIKTFGVILQVNDFHRPTTHTGICKTGFLCNGNFVLKMNENLSFL